ncbi:V protein [Gierle apodemus virus]|uniref:Non-structural protein V n=1 Tax=Gierle apodemus virus TaxID=2940985 RepID=A0AAE9HTR3_9MONO|nr:V protein [Gierle apodemus virus]
MAEKLSRSVDNALSIVSCIKEASASGGPSQEVQELLQSCRAHSNGKKPIGKITVLPPLVRELSQSDGEGFVGRSGEIRQDHQEADTEGDDTDTADESERDDGLLPDAVHPNDDQSAHDEADPVKGVGCSSAAGGVSNTGGTAPIQSSTPYATDDDASTGMGDGMRQIGGTGHLKRQDISVASDEDIIKLVGTPGVKPVPSARRLNLPRVVDESPGPVPRALTKKGHRREYDFVWDHQGLLVKSWCNPVCAPIRPRPTHEQCRCGECPAECSECEEDGQDKYWYGQ